MFKNLENPLAGKQIQGFVIFAMARTGSGFLLKLLDSHPRIKCHRELFHAQNIGIFLDEEIPGADKHGLIPGHRTTFLNKWDKCTQDILRLTEQKKKSSIQGAVIGSGSGAAKFALWAHDEIRDAIGGRLGAEKESVQIDLYPGEREFLQGFTKEAKKEVWDEFESGSIARHESAAIKKIDEQEIVFENGVVKSADFIIVVPRAGGPCPDLDLGRHKGLVNFTRESGFYDDVRLRDSDPEDFLRKFFAVAHDNKSVVGFKLMLVQNEDAKKLCIKDKALKKIVLYRDNLLASFSSDQIMKKARKMSMTREDLRNTPLKVGFDANEFESYRKKVSNLYSQLERIKDKEDKQWLYLEYKDLKTFAMHERLTSFLGVDHDAHLSTSSKKLNPVSIIDRFTNPGEVRSYLKSIGRKKWESE